MMKNESTWNNIKFNRRKPKWNETPNEEEGINYIKAYQINMTCRTRYTDKISEVIVKVKMRKIWLTDRPKAAIFWRDSGEQVNWRKVGSSNISGMNNDISLVLI